MVGQERSRNHRINGDIAAFGGTTEPRTDGGVARARACLIVMPNIRGNACQVERALKTRKLRDGGGIEVNRTKACGPCGGTREGQRLARRAMFAQGKGPSLNPLARHHQ
jgi:hypothetical protein